MKRGFKKRRMAVGSKRFCRLVAQLSEMPPLLAAWLTNR